MPPRKTELEIIRETLRTLIVQIGSHIDEATMALDRANSALDRLDDVFGDVANMVDHWEE